MKIHKMAFFYVLVFFFFIRAAAATTHSVSIVSCVLIYFLSM